MLLERTLRSCFLMCVWGDVLLSPWVGASLERGVITCLRAERWVKRKQFRDQPG